MKDGSAPSEIPPPLWLLAELTYKCPLQCPYCSNPTDYDRFGSELTTEEWRETLRQARALGACQLGLSGGEPLVRSDLEEIVYEARRLGFYTNLITSSLGMKPERVERLHQSGLDHIQVSFQDADPEINDFLAGTSAFQHKREIAEAVKANGFPMVLCFVLHRQNIHRMERMVELADQLDADYVELAMTQYHGWAWANRTALLPNRQQVERAEQTAHELQARFRDRMEIYYVVPDYYEGRPKACVNGWGNVFLSVAPDGTALPCHSAASLPLEFPNVRDADLAWIWRDSDAFNRFRGFGWMNETCRNCPEREQDFGGCRCQAFQMTGDLTATDPACAKAPSHHLVEEAVAAADQPQADEQPLIFRNPRNARRARATAGDESGM